MSGAPQALDRALADWRAALGPARVATSGDVLEGARRATFAAAQRPAAVLQPGDRAEVRACLRIAVRHGVPLHPVSRGRNWGYGSRLPPRDGAVLLSLHRLDRILELDEDLAYVTLEPGVSFAMLADHLRRRGSRLLPPLTGTSGDASIVGNVLQRGLGKGPYEDIAARSCAYEVVLPSGDVVHTGLAAHPGARAAPLFPAGPGPSLQGLFAQGGPGVVTRLTLWLEPAPALHQRLFLRLRDASALGVAIERLRPAVLRAGGALQLEFVNAHRALALRTRFPFGRHDPGAALPPAWARRAVAGDGGPGWAWFGCATLWAGDGPELRWRREHLEAACGAAAWEVEAPAAAPEAAIPGAGIRAAYWRKPGPPPARPDPDRDGCGVIWCASVVPMRGAEVVAAAGLAEETLLTAGFEPLVSLRPQGGRAVLVVVGLVYDRDVPGDDGRAAACHRDLRRRLEARGWYPYRLGLQDLAEPPPRAADDEAVHAAVRRALDPGGILAAPPFPGPRPATERSAAPPVSAPSGAPDRFRAVGFGAVAEAPEVGALRRTMDGILARVAEEGLPPALAREAAGLLRTYGGGEGGFFRLFPVPAWSFLHWVPAGAPPSPATLARAREAHALALFLHLWDDHLCDGELAPDLLRLQLRTAAWARCADCAAALAADVGAPASVWAEAAAHYLMSLHRPGPAGDVAAYAERFRDQSAIWAVVPDLLGRAVGGPGAARELQRLVGDFSVAWRLLDDVQDVRADAAAGRETAVSLLLPPEGRALWHAGAADGPVPAAVEAAVEASGAIPDLMARVATLLGSARSAAERGGWPALAREIAQAALGPASAPAWAVAPPAGAPAR